MARNQKAARKEVPIARCQVCGGWDSLEGMHLYYLYEADKSLAWVCDGCHKREEAKIKKLDEIPLEEGVIYVVNTIGEEVTQVWNPDFQEWEKFKLSDKVDYYSGIRKSFSFN